MSLQPDLSIKAHATGFTLELLLKIGKSQMDKLANIQQLKDQEHEQTQTEWQFRWCFLRYASRAKLFGQSSH